MTWVLLVWTSIVAVPFGSSFESEVACEIAAVEIRMIAKENQTPEPITKCININPTGEN